LLARLLMNLTFKDVAAVFAHRMAANERYVGRGAGLEDDVTPRPPEVVLPVDARELAAIAERVFADIGEEPDVDHLDLELPSVQEAILAIQDRMTVAVESDFENLVAHCERSVEVVAYFLGLLELSRWGILQVTQEDWLSPIHIRYNDDAARSSFDALVRGEELS